MCIRKMANFCIYKHSLYSGGYVTCPNDDVTFVSKCQSDIQSHERKFYSDSRVRILGVTKTECHIKTFKN